MSPHAGVPSAPIPTTHSTRYQRAADTHLLEPCDDPLVLRGGECFALEPEAKAVFDILPETGAEIEQELKRGGYRVDWRDVVRDLRERGLITQSAVSLNEEERLNTRPDVEGGGQELGMLTIARRAEWIRRRLRHGGAPRDTHHNGRILIVAYGGIGDMACVVPLLRELRQARPEAEIDVIVKKRLAGLYRHLTLIDQTFPWCGQSEMFRVKGGVSDLASLLYQRNYDIAISAMEHFGGTCRWFLGKAICHVTHAPLQVGTRDRMTGRVVPRMASWFRVRLRRARRCHEADRLLDLLPLLGIEQLGTEQQEPWTWPDPAALARIEKTWARDQPLVGLAPISGERKMWPVNRFAALAAWLVDRFGSQVALFGSSGQADASATIRMLSGRSLWDLAGRTELAYLPAYVNRCDLIVSIDTGISHIAALYQKPQITLFGPTNPVQYRPWRNPRARVVRAESGRMEDIALETVQALCHFFIEESSPPLQPPGFSHNTRTSLRGRSRSHTARGGPNS